MHLVLKKQKGFTIVELLIVVVVIAILAAITIVAYNGISNRAKDSAVASLVSQNQKKVALFSVTNNDEYPATLAEAGVDSVAAANSQYSVNNTSNPKGYCITSTQNGVSSYVAKSYSYNNGTTQTLDQSTPVRGVCPGHSATNGQTTSNLIINPALRSATVSNWGALTSTGGTGNGARVTSVSGLSSLGITTAYRNTVSGTPGSWWRVQNASNPVVTGGQSYVLSAYVRPSVTANSGIIILWSTPTGTVEDSGGSFATQTGGTWVRKSIIATAPAGATSARFHFGATGNGADGVYYDVAAAMFYPGSTLYNYADGSSAGWIWDGATDISTSRGPAL